MPYPFKNQQEKYIKLPIELRDFAGLDAYTKTVYMILCSYDKCWVSIRTIHKFTGISIERINKSIKQLVMYNMISYVPGYSFKTGKTQSNKYTIIHKSLWNIKSTVSPRSTVKQVKHEDSPVSPDDTVQYRQEGSSIITYNNYNPSVSPGSTVYHNETKSLISKPMNETEVKEFAVSMRSKQGIDISKAIGQRNIPASLVKIFVYQYLDSKPITENDCNVLENLGKIWNRKDSFTKSIIEYYNEYGKLEL